MYITSLPFCVTSPRSTKYGILWFVDTDFGKAETAEERILFNGSDAVTNGNDFNIVTVLEGFFSDGSDTVADGDSL